MWPAEEMSAHILFFPQHMSGWHVQNSTDPYQPRVKWIFPQTCNIHVWMVKLFGTWSNLLHVNCSAVFSSQSITHLLTSILLSPMGQKCPSLGQKENKQDGRKGMLEMGRRVCSAFTCHCVIHARNLHSVHFLFLGQCHLEISHALIAPKQSGRAVFFNNYEAFCQAIFSHVYSHIFTLKGKYE